MKKTHRNEAVRILPTFTEEERIDGIDELVANAARGDRYAIGCIAIAVSPGAGQVWLHRMVRQLAREHLEKRAIGPREAG